MVDPRTGNVHVVNDLRRPLVDAEVVVAVDGRTRIWRGDIDADAVTFVGAADLDDAVDVEVSLAHADLCARREPLPARHPRSRPSSIEADRAIGITDAGHRPFRPLGNRHVNLCTIRQRFRTAA